MDIHLQRIIESAGGIRLASALGRGLPLSLGYCLADFVAARIAVQRDSKLVRAVRANQWVIRGENLGKAELDRVVRETFQHSARSIFDLYHYIENKEAARRLISMDETTQALLKRPEYGERGLMLVGLHISSFDLILQILCQLGMKMMVLTIPDPQGGRRKEFELRQRNGMNLVPASVTAFRHALNHLQQGGVVLTGIDRPISQARSSPRFFSRPAALPMSHVFLAVKSQVPVQIIAANLLPDGKYHIFTSDLIVMDHFQNQEKGMVFNAEKILSIAEVFIRRIPQQWSMSLPVWPETLDLVSD